MLLAIPVLITAVLLGAGISMLDKAIRWIYHNRREDWVELGSPPGFLWKPKGCGNQYTLFVVGLCLLFSRVETNDDDYCDMIEIFRICTFGGWLMTVITFLIIYVFESML